MLMSEAVELWLSQRRSERYSPCTLKSYRLEVGRFIRVMGDLPVEEIKLPTLRGYVSGPDCEHLKPTSLAHRVRMIKAFFTWLHEEEYLDRNPGLRLREPKLPERLPKDLTFDQLELLRDACETPREHALIEFLFASGCRISEAVKVTRNAMNWDRRAVVVMGKNSKEREVYFGTRANLWLQRYLAIRHDDCPYLLATERRPIRGLSTHQAWYIVKKIAARVNMRAEVWPHRLRHTLGTTLLNQGAPLAVVQSLLGHASPVTTELYARLSGTSRQQAYQKAFIQ